VRVVSLVPSATETLLAWGVEVVACTRFCEQPQLRHVGGTKDPDLAAIVSLAPDLVVMDREENRRDDAEWLVSRGVRVHPMHVTSLTALSVELAALAAAVGADPEVVHLPAAAPVTCTAFVPIWRRPWMTIGAATYGSSLLVHLGVANVFADASVPYPEVTLAGAAARRPDLVVLPSEPYPFAARHVAEVAAAIAGARVVLVDGADLFWWGVRTTAALGRLAAALA
jgi:ABC-type Fe3+-hydroxamate transport system substrate-binding protein